MSTKEQIEKDLKNAMLSGDKSLVSVLRGLKSSILNVEIAQGSREQGLQEEVVLGVLSKEAKKRQESADMYGQAGDTTRQQAELSEKASIEKYLPKQLSDEDLNKIIDAVVVDEPVNGQNMGQIIGKVKQQTAGTADGSRIATLIKLRMEQ